VFNLGGILYHSGHAINRRHQCTKPRSKDNSHRVISNASHSGGVPTSVLKSIGPNARRLTPSARAFSRMAANPSGVSVEAMSAIPEIVLETNPRAERLLQSLCRTHQADLVSQTSA
jgi:hypothetical protein